MGVIRAVGGGADQRQAAVQAAAEALRAGALVGLPTETVYGLAADATDGRAVARIFEAKGRPRFNPLIVHVADFAAAERLGVFGDEARQLAASFWPGPLTLVVPRREPSPLSDLVTAGLDSVALRLPANDLARAVIRAAGRPLAAPSANRSGRLSPTTAAAVAEDLGPSVALVLDDGPTPVGVESTIVGCLGPPLLLRPGGVPREAIAAVLGRPLPDAEEREPARPLAPGRLASHYAPRAGLRLEAAEVRPGEAWLGFGGRSPAGFAGAVAAADLSPRGDLREAAANLFAMLRALDATGATMIAVAPIPGEGLGEAIRDRLARAAAPRHDP